MGGVSVDDRCAAWVGAILAGAVQCHRIIYAVLGIASLYFVGSYALFAGRSFWNLILPVAMFLSVHFSGYRSVHPDGGKNVSAILSALAIGIPSGIFLVILTPLHALFKPNTLLWGSIIGSILSLVALFTATLADCAKYSSADSAEHPSPSPSVDWKEDAVTDPAAHKRSLLLRMMAPVVPMAFTFALFMLAFVLSLVVRSGPRTFAEQLISSLALWNGYLWRSGISSAWASFTSS